MIREKIKINKKMNKEFIEYNFTIPEGTDQVAIKVEYPREDGNVVDVAIMYNDKLIGATGSSKNEILLTNDYLTTTGYLPGLKKNYTLLFRNYRIIADFELQIEINFIELKSTPKLVELHCHSLSSDGQYNINELIEFAKKRKLDCLYVTDHFSINSSRFIAEETDLQILYGFEFTCDFGHMGMHNLTYEQIKYRINNYDDIARYLAKVHRNKKTFQIINHPFGDCEGGMWLFDYNYDAIECLNGFDFKNNIKALELYQELSENGVMLPIVGGSDFHNSSILDQNASSIGYPCNIVTTKDCSSNAIFTGIRNFANVVSYFPHQLASIKIINDQIAIDNLEKFNAIEVRIYSENGLVQNKNISNNKFIRVEIWQDSKEFLKLMNQEIGLMLTTEYQSVPIFVSNPIMGRRNGNKYKIK